MDSELIKAAKAKAFREAEKICLAKMQTLKKQGEGYCEQMVLLSDMMDVFRKKVIDNGGQLEDYFYDTIFEGPITEEIRNLQKEKQK